MTGPEQHANTVREALAWHPGWQKAAESLTALEALAERADTLERELDDMKRVLLELDDAGMQARAEADRLGNLLAQERSKPGGSFDQHALLQQITEEADRLREALRETRGHLRPEIGGRFDQRAAVTVIDAALAGPQTEEPHDFPADYTGWRPLP